MWPNLLLSREILIPAAIMLAVVGWGEFRASQARTAARAEVAERYISTIEAIENADIPTDRAAIVKRLRELSQ